MDGKIDFDPLESARLLCLFQGHQLYSTADGPVQRGSEKQGCPVYFRAFNYIVQRMALHVASLRNKADLFISGLATVQNSGWLYIMRL